MLKRLEITGFKSFTRKTVLDFSANVTAIVGPNGSGKSNIAEAFRFALGEQSMKSMRGKRNEDLLFNGSHSLPRTNRAAVAIIFDNTKRIFKLDFDEVVVERAVFRDGTSEYTINGSKVRLRDIQELLAGANIGDKGHHIISQGEADRILLASPRERREMLEDALGLKAYEYKKQEAQRKLEKTEENIEQVKAVRRELTPHLHFLSKQVEKLEHAQELRQELIELSQTYFSIEDIYLSQEKDSVSAEIEKARALFASVSAELASIEEHNVHNEEREKLECSLRSAESALEDAVQEYTKLTRKVGRVEGALSSAREHHKRVVHDPYAKVPHDDLVAMRDEIERQVNEASDEPSALRAALNAISKATRVFFEQFAVPADDFLADEEHSMHVLENEKEVLIKKESASEETVEKARYKVQRVREDVAAHEETLREGQRRLIELAHVKAREESVVARGEARLFELVALLDKEEHDKGEALSLAGAAAVSYTPLEECPKENRTQQEARRHTLERLKIRLEESGGTGDDVRKEHSDALERERFLSHELADLAQSAIGLRVLISDLSDELAKSFTNGLVQVNESFGKFFGLMFDGGGARLVLEELSEQDDDEKTPFNRLSRRPGIDITVHLPKKRVQSLMQLSGGERALTSIALIFAMSQVNPPPFLMLDETEAALDEANSRRYGDMIESLAKHSQLIVITHNRETMSRARFLYGVTMGSEGVSKLLSVKFDEAVQVAK